MGRELDTASDEEFDRLFDQALYSGEGEADASSESEESADDSTEVTSEDFNEESDDNVEEEESSEEHSDTDEDDSEEETSEDDEVEDTEESDETDSEDEDKDPDESDYKSQIEELLSPFRANGMDMSVKNVSEARRLMQMGANYNKKMGILKPRLNLVRVLEDNDLLDQDKINQLIDVSKGDAKAISALLNNLGVDPLTLSSDTDDYKPNTYNVNEELQAIEDVLEDIKDASPSTYRTLDSSVINKWDVQSVQAFAQKPELLEVVAQHIGTKTDNGTSVFETISNELQRRKAIGLQKGVSDLQAYHDIGLELFGNPEEPKDVIKPKVTKRKPDPERKRKVTASSKQSASKPKAKGKKELTSSALDNLSDAEFDAYMDKMLG
ncbi:MAG: hypothetical protein Tp152SUR00d2C52646391_9 [Prokaryotic dsDNA virus sp.]|nr:MAG: hypothetical protein Tp152SUR00d2C52646391_9 [Prokaryotic dsDNA virus sp.]|tara:strand:- start:1201 stop:2343 length:1143 start_codon:yes stop_codon:yes gene_type:complete